MTKTESTLISVSPSNVLGVVFTFNRPEYLKNLVQSHRSFAPEIPLLIIDDASTDPLQVDTLKFLEGTGVEIINAAGDDSRHGGLYSNMNMALEFAARRGYRFINLLQDDMQIVRPATEDIVQACVTLGNIKDGLHMSLTFRKHLDVKNEPKPCCNPFVYHSQNLQVADTGIIHVGRALDSGFRFQDSEAAHSQLAVDLGFKGFVFRDPLVAFVPWPVYFRNRKLAKGSIGLGLGRGIAISPMRAAEIDLLKCRNIELLPYAEDWCRPQSGFWLKPYNYTSSKVEWLRRIIRSIPNQPNPTRYLPGIVFARSID